MTNVLPWLQRVCCVLLLLVVASSAVAQSQPGFWRASLGKGTVYLLGSMHFGYDGFYPLPEQVERAYQRADVLVVEVDMSQVTPQVAVEAITRHGGLKPGQSLSRILSAELYAALLQKVEKVGLPIAALQHLQPWLVAVQLIEAEVRKTALRQNLGIDLHFINRGDKPVEQLESLDQQLKLFGGLSIHEQEKFLRQTLRDMDGSRSYLTAMADAWRQGDLVSLEKSLITPFKGDADAQQLFDKVFTQRNRRMTTAVLDYLNGERDVFVVVGAGHMLGDDGIIAQLRDHEVSVERVAFSLNSHR